MLCPISIFIISNELFKGTAFNFRRSFLDLFQNIDISISYETILEESV